MAYYDYNKYVELCAGEGKKPTRMAVILGLPKSIISRWKAASDNGEEGGISDASLHIIADHFGLTIDAFKYTKVETKKEPDTQTDAGLSTIDQEIIELFKRLSPEEQVRELAYLRDRAASQDK